MPQNTQRVMATKVLKLLCAKNHWYALWLWYQKIPRSLWQFAYIVFPKACAKRLLGSYGYAVLCDNDKACSDPNHRHVSMVIQCYVPKHCYLYTAVLVGHATNYTITIMSHQLNRTLYHHNNYLAHNTIGIEQCFGTHQPYMPNIVLVDVPKHYEHALHTPTSPMLWPMQLPNYISMLWHALQVNHELIILWHIRSPFNKECTNEKYGTTKKLGIPSSHTISQWLVTCTEQCHAETMLRRNNAMQKQC